MSIGFENITALDSNTVADAIMQDIINVESLESLEKTVETDLSATDLFKIDCAILSSLRKTQDFSRDLLEQLETGKFKDIVQKPPKKDIILDIQQNAMLDIIYPMQDMFDKFANIIVEKLN